MNWSIAVLIWSVSRGNFSFASEQISSAKSSILMLVSPSRSYDESLINDLISNSQF